MDEKRFIPNPEKPKILYHASPVNNIDFIEPRSGKTREASEGPKVFASPSRAVASMFLIDSNSSWVMSGERGNTPFIVISDEKRYRDADVGGTIYSVPVDSFETDPDMGLRKSEWTSEESVEPTDQEYVPSAIEDMIDQGVLVYFVDKKTWDEIQAAEDDWAIIETLEPATKT